MIDIGYACAEPASSAPSATVRCSRERRAHVGPQDQAGNGSGVGSTTSGSGWSGSGVVTGGGGNLSGSGSGGGNFGSGPAMQFHSYAFPFRAANNVAAD